MIYAKPMHWYTRAGAYRERLNSLRRPAARGAAVLALLCGLVPILVSTPLSAQEVAQPGQAATININTASAQTLADGLNGVGLARAQEIVRHRESYGPFVSVEELAEVKGIGKSTIDKNRPVITLE